MDGSTPTEPEHTKEAALWLGALGWVVILVAVSPVVIALLFFDPVRPWFVSVYGLLAVQCIPAWRLGHAVRAPHWRRELRLARRWMSAFIVGCPSSVLLYAWVWAHRRILPSWADAATFCVGGIAGLGLHMFYLHLTKAVRELGGLLRSPGLTAAADQTVALQRLVPPFWLGAYISTRLLQHLAANAGPTEFFFGGWVLGIIWVAITIAAVAGPPLYWAVAYVLLMRQAAREAARATRTASTTP